MYKPRIAPKPCLSSKEDLQDPVSVFCRIRPPDLPCDELCVQPYPPDQPTGTIKLRPPVNSLAYRNGNAKELLYKFQRVFGEESRQKEIFDEVGMPLIQDLLNGKNVLLFAYGMTGSGKTYTMEGTKQDGGLVRRSVDVIFNSIKDFQSKKYVFKPDRMNGFESQSIEEAQCTAELMQERQKHALKNIRRIYTRAQNKLLTFNENTSLERVPDYSVISNIDEDNVYSVFVSYVEIYNKYVYDLLEEFPENNMTKNLQSKFLREDSKGNMYVHGCTEIEVKSAEEAIEILLKGQKQRKVAHTKLNCESSRSHSIFTLRIVQAPLDAQGEEVITDKTAITVSQLSLVDLAGSERTNRTKSTGDRIKEAGNINNSLMVLRQCIETLRDNQMHITTKKRIPYRSDKLTHFLGNYFEGNGTVKMIVCVSPRPEDYDETLPVMKFAELAAEVALHRVIPSARQDYGLTPGRRRANIIFREARKQLHDEGLVHPDLEQIDLTPVYALSTDWPGVSFTLENFAESVDNLKIFLKSRMEKKEKLNIDLQHQFSSLVDKIGDMDRQNVEFRQDNRSLKVLYEDSMKNLRQCQVKLMNAEMTNEQLQRKFFDYNSLMDHYRQVCEERDMVKSQGNLDKQRLKVKIKAKFELEREKLARDMNNQLKEQKVQLKSQMFVTQVKALQNMFDGQGTPCRTPKGHHRSDEGLKVKSHSTVKQSRSDPKLNETLSNQNGLPVNNRRHRRSQSQGDHLGGMWLDHNPSQVVETGTILKPNMQNKRTVRRIRSGDFSKNVSNYCLTTQNQDSSGELETKLFKGDVLPTVGGGVQVVLQDVEILRQRDPLHMHVRKRSSDGTPKVDHETLRERCAVGIVGSTPNRSYYNKRPKK